jgi:exonuclease VII small subunit
MSITISLLFSLILILTGPELLWAKSAPKAGKNAAEATESVRDLEAATADLQENIKDLRRNITSWRKIQNDGQLSQAEKKVWRDKANSYVQECEAYNELLVKINAKKLPKSEVSKRFLTARETFQRELQYLRETLQMP